jgi:hypothetical protein
MKSDPEQEAVGKLGVLPHRVVDLIDYQAGAIVSREVVKGETGTVAVRGEAETTYDRDPSTSSG